MASPGESNGFTSPLKEKYINLFSIHSLFLLLPSPSILSSLLSRFHILHTLLLSRLPTPTPTHPNSHRLPSLFLSLAIFSHLAVRELTEEGEDMWYETLEKVFEVEEADVGGRWEAEVREMEKVVLEGEGGKGIKEWRKFAEESLERWKRVMKVKDVVVEKEASKDDEEQDDGSYVTLLYNKIVGRTSSSLGTSPNLEVELSLTEEPNEIVSIPFTDSRKSHLTNYSRRKLSLSLRDRQMTPINRFTLMNDNTSSSSLDTITLVEDKMTSSIDSLKSLETEPTSLSSISIASLEISHNRVESGSQAGGEREGSMKKKDVGKKVDRVLDWRNEVEGRKERKFGWDEEDQSCDDGEETWEGEADDEDSEEDYE
jgi:hypothetical protein